MVLDSREQIVGIIPKEIPVIVEALPTGDMSVVGYTDRVAVDRKQLGDFVGCLTASKDRFGRMLDRMRALDFAAIVVEATHADVTWHTYRSQVSPAFVLGAAARITTKYRVPVFFCGSLNESTDFAVRLLRAWWRDRGLTRPEAAP